ncbi:MAG: hypothetical protein ACHQUC_00035 [Chlamydiales bacterium]
MSTTVNLMSTKEEQEISLSFPKEKEEEIISVFRAEDLIKEYNSRIFIGSTSGPIKKHPLSLLPINVNSGFPVIRAMTPYEIESWHRRELREHDQMLIKNVLQDQYSIKGLFTNIPNLVAGVSFIELTRELGLMGRVSYKTVGGTTYVIIKGYAGRRSNLQAARYLNTNPQIVRFGIAKVSVKDRIKKGFRISILIYGGIKIAEATEMLWNEGKLESDFFSQMDIDITKLTITNLVAGAAGGAVALAGVPVALGAGIVLAVGIVTGIALDMIDKKLGLAKKLSEAADRMWNNLKEKWKTLSSNLDNSCVDWDPLGGMVIGVGFVLIHRRDCSRYMA